MALELIEIVSQRRGSSNPPGDNSGDEIIVFRQLKHPASLGHGLVRLHQYGPMNSSARSRGRKSWGR